MKKITSLLFILCCLASTLFAQNIGKKEPFVLPITSVILENMEKTDMDSIFSAYAVLNINFTGLKNLLRTTKYGQTATVSMQLPKLPTMTVELKPYDLRSPNFVGTINGKSENLPIEMRECITFKGSIKGDAASEVLLTITDNFLQCSFTYNKVAYTIEPCSNYIKLSVEFVFYENKAKIQKENNKATCGNANTETIYHKIHSNNFSTEKLQNCRIAEVALDADCYFSEKYKANSYAVMVSIFFQVRMAYIRDMRISFVMSYVNIFTERSKDPYVVDFRRISLSGSGYLANAKKYWLNRTTPRDFVHIFSGGMFEDGYLNGQALSVGSICTNMQDAIAFTTFYQIIPLLSSNRSITVAHEIGHLFGGTHQGCDQTIMCDRNLPETQLIFSDGSKTEIGNFINNNIRCFDNIENLGNKIEGADFICDTAPVQYYTYNFPYDLMTAYWNVSKTGNIEVEQTMGANWDRQITFRVTKIGNGVGSFTLSYTLSLATACDMQTFTKTIYLGKPTDYELTIEESSQNCRDITSNIYMIGSENAKQVRWEYIHPITRVWTSYGTLPYNFGYFAPDFFTIPEFSAWYRFARQGACISFSFRAIPINDCGELTQGTENTSVILTFCKGGGAMYCRQAQTTTNETLALKLSPNPAEDGMVEISIIGNGYEVVSASEVYEVVIYNTLGQVVKTFKTKELQNKVDVQDLKVGIYIVKVVYENQILQNKLLINR